MTTVAPITNIVSNIVGDRRCKYSGDDGNFGGGNSGIDCAVVERSLQPHDVYFRQVWRVLFAIWHLSELLL